MDSVSSLPPEIHEIIYEKLDGDSLWPCLSVNKTWRIRANSNKLWLPHYKSLKINARDVPKTECILNYEFNLCGNALEWKKRKSTISYWKKKEFKCHNLPYLDDPRFFTHNSSLIIIDYPTVWGISILRDDFSMFKFSLPPWVPFDEGNALMNDDHLIIVCNTNVMVYKRDKCYNLHSIFSFTNKNQIEVATSDFIDFIKTDDVNIGIIFVFSHLSGNKLWVSYRVNLTLHYKLIDIVTNEITSIASPFDSEPVEYTATNQRIIFSFPNEIVVYEASGRMLFQLVIGEFCSSAANDNILCVFKPSSIVTFDMFTGRLLHSLPNDCANRPILFVSSHKNIMVIIRKKENTHFIMAFSADSGKQLWVFQPPFHLRDHFDISFEEVYGTLLTINFTYFKLINYVSEIYVLNIESGQLVSNVSCTNLNILAPNFFIEDINPMQLSIV